MTQRLDSDITIFPKRIDLGLTTPCRAVGEAYEKQSAGGTKKRKRVLTPVELERAVRFYESGGYLTLNFSGMKEPTPALTPLHKFRHHFHAVEWGWLNGREVNDPSSSTLLLMGLPGRGTGFHVDWSEAYNVALPLVKVGSPVGLSVVSTLPMSALHCTSSFTQPQCTCLQTKPDSPVARWDFINPVKAEAAAHFVKKWRATGFVDDRTKLHLTKPQVDELQAAMGTDPANQQADVFSMHQFVGDRVHVPPGWLHQVTNVQPCMKLAWDFYDKAHMAAYVASWQLIASGVTRENAEDYMAVGRVLVQAIRKNIRG